MLPGATAIERACLACWPAIEVEWDGVWVRRAAGGYTKRANSAQCFDPADDSDVPARIAAASAWFTARGLRPTFRVNHQSGPLLVAVLEGGDWVAIDHSHVVAMALDDTPADPRGEVLGVRDAAFLDVQRQLKQLDDAELRRLDAVLAMLAVPAAGIVLRDDAGAPLAAGLMAVADGIAVTGNVITDPARRRQGAARAMMRTGHAWARGAGARFAALNVQADNPAAIALYAGLGYVQQYDYRYYVPRVP
jgi:ribosomal protein S18 acetylase RimI-like enzyme